MAEEFGDFGTPPPPGGPPSGSPLPSDTEAAKKAAESMKDLTEKVKDLKTKTELAVERIMDLSREGFSLKEGLRKNNEEMKKIDEKRKLGIKIPYGPYLALAAILWILIGEMIFAAFSVKNIF